MKKFLVFFIPILLLISCAKEEEIVLEPSEIINIDLNEPLVGSVTSDNINIEPYELLDEENGRLYNKVTYDLIILSDEYRNDHKNIAYAIDSFNNNNSQAAKDFIETSKEEVRTMVSERGDDQLSFTSESSVDICRNDDKVLSFTNLVSSFTGGAHGNAGTICYNYDIINDKIVKLDDIFTDTEKLHSEIVKKLDTEEEYKDCLFEEYKETLDDLFKEKDSLHFIIYDDRVDMIFDPYLLGPWASGTIIVSFGIKDYTSFINQEYAK